MRIVALIQHDAVSALRATLVDDESLVAVDTWDALVNALSAGQGELALVDADLAPSGSADQVIQLAQEAGVPALLYTMADPGVVKLTLDSIRTKSYPEKFLFKGVEDTALRFRRRAEVALLDSYGERILDGIREPLSKLPAALQLRIQRLFLAFSAGDSPRTIAAESHLSHKSMDRWLHRVGLAPTSTLVYAARILRALVDLNMAHEPLRTIAMRVGCSGARPLARQWEHVTGLSRDTLRQATITDDLLDRIVARLLAPVSKRQDPVSTT